MLSLLGNLYQIILEQKSDRNIGRTSVQTETRYNHIVIDMREHQKGLYYSVKILSDACMETQP